MLILIKEPNPPNEDTLQRRPQLPEDMFFSASRSAKLSEDAKMRTSAMETNRCKKVTATSIGIP